MYRMWTKWIILTDVFTLAVENSNRKSMKLVHANQNTIMISVTRFSVNSLCPQNMKHSIRKMFTMQRKNVAATHWLYIPFAIPTSLKKIDAQCHTRN